uniref:Mediator of RNA polymerase II transcription subunit 4 n=1 Tax=Panagrolaimus sp. ES5 TaxID=591445 RepID=A0AC34FQ38_9BILA
MEGVGGVSLKEDLVELSNSIDAILTQTIAAFVNCAKKRTVDDDLAHLTSLFSNKSDCFKKMVRQVNFRHGKEDYIKKLDTAVFERSELLAAQTEKLSEAFKLVSNAHFNGQKALRKAKAQSKSFEPEEVLRFSHLISKNFSVASPHFWQQGDPMRPYPTELHFRISNFGNAVDGIKDPKELSMVPSSINLPSSSMYNGVSSNTAGDINDQTITNNQEISSMSFLPSSSTLDDQKRVELIMPNSSNTVAGPSISNQQTTYTSGLMSSDEDSDDD